VATVPDENSHFYHDSITLLLCNSLFIVDFKNIRVAYGLLYYKLKIGTSL